MYFRDHTFTLHSEIREFGQKFIFRMTLLVIHIRYVDSLEFVICAMLIVVALKCYPQPPNLLLSNLSILPKLSITPKKYGYKNTEKDPKFSNEKVFLHRS